MKLMGLSDLGAWMPKDSMMGLAAPMNLFSIPGWLPDFHGFSAVFKIFIGFQNFRGFPKISIYFHVFKRSRGLDA